MGKKDVRNKFRNDVYSRDKYCCRKCSVKSDEINAINILDAHHITDRNEIVNGGYVKENGISLCEGCHLKAEKYHITNGESWEEGFHPNDLYKLIGSSKELAIEKSKKL